MAVIYLHHPYHGIKVATTIEEAKADRENGWTDWSPEAFKAGSTVSTATPAESDEVATLKAALAAANERAEKAEAAISKDTKKSPAPPAATGGVVPDFLKGNPQS